MKQMPEQEEDTDAIVKALYEFIKVCNEIDLDMKKAYKVSPDEIVVMRGRKKIKVKL